MENKRPKNYKSIKYRIFPTDKQKEILSRCFGARRFVYNYLCNVLFETNYLEDTINNKNATSVLTLRDLIRKTGPEWLRTGSDFINVTVIENSVEDFVNAYNKYKKNVKKVFKTEKLDSVLKYRPKIKKKKDTTDSCTFNRKNDSFVKFVNGNLNIGITRTLGRETFKTKREIKLDLEKNKIKQVTFSHKSGKYYMTLVCETQTSSKVYEPNTKIGIDLGVKTAAVCYDGNKYFSYSLPNKIKKIENNRRIKDSQLSKSKKDSKRHYKLLKTLNKVYRYKINFRNNWQDNLVVDLCRKYETIIIDDMPVLGKGFKTHNNKKISIAPYRFKLRLDMKSKFLLNNIVIIPRGTPTTQKCSNCGNILHGNDKLTLANRIYNCPKCNHIQDRDENSAKNVYNYNPDI